MAKDYGKKRSYISEPAELLAIKDTLSSLRILIPIVAILQVFLIVTWFLDLTGDRTSAVSALYLGGYVFMLLAGLGIGLFLIRCSRDIPRNRENIGHAQMTYAWMLPVWAAILTLFDALTASHTFSTQFYVMANVLTMGICYMSRFKWTMIQLVTGITVMISAHIMPLEDHFTFVSELAAYIVISILAGRSLLYMKIKAYERQTELSDFLKTLEYDSLTGVYNRETFYRRTEQVLKEDPDTPYTLVVSDIEEFKQINSAFGNEKGDEVLRYLAGRFRTYGKITARYGADQFITLIQTIEILPEQQLDEVTAAIAEQAPVRNLSVKYGYYEIDDRTLPVSEMCDRALLAVRSIQHNYTRQMASYNGPVSQQHLLAKKYSLGFQEAIDRREFVLWYQPQIDPVTGKVVGAEALVRWKKEDGYIMPPSDFLNVFEENGQIIELDEYVFRTVCHLQKMNLDSGRELFPVSVNLSRKSMARPDLVQVYKKIIQETGIPIGSVPVEITESAAIRSVMIRPVVQEFCDNGFTVHMDDFGSGQSSINGLNILHIDTVKIDKSLVDNIGQKGGDTILRGLMGIMKELGLRMIAEGVENEEQLDFLIENHVDVIQGFYYSKPLPTDEFEAFVRENS